MSEGTTEGTEMQGRKAEFNGLNMSRITVQNPGLGSHCVPWRFVEADVLNTSNRPTHVHDMGTCRDFRIMRITK